MENFMAACWPELLPQANAAVRNLLPNVPWKPTSAQQEAPVPHVQNVDVVANSDIHSSSSSSSHIKTQPAQQGQQAQQTQQLSFQEPVYSVLPLAAVVLDLGLRQPGKQTRQLYILKVQICMPQVQPDMLAYRHKQLCVGTQQIHACKANSSNGLQKLAIKTYGYCSVLSSLRLKANAQMWLYCAEDSMGVSCFHSCL